ncbi:MAG: hypothetical protein ACK5WZ_03255, partial [Pseudobdellovibrionaceae bacterium]
MLIKLLGYLTISLMALSCSNQNLSREEFGLSVAGFKVFQLGAVTSVLRLNNTTQTLSFAVACPPGSVQLMAKAQQTPWVEFHSFTCGTAATTSIDLDYPAAMTVLQNAGFVGAITPEVNLEFKIKHSISESDVISVKILKAEVNPASVIVSLGG